ncbi:MAG: hypothetical protein JWQ81_1705 [Amycolatopsis sp.]|nr:hypothetical protein [Amycolatopsis sp.]
MLCTSTRPARRSACPGHSHASPTPSKLLRKPEVKARRKAAAATGTLSAKTTWGDWWSIFNSDRVFESDTGGVEAAIVKNYLMPRWKDVALNMIAHNEVKTWVKDLQTGHAPSAVERQGSKAPSYVQRVFSVFSVSITAAVDRGVLTASPTAGVRLPKRQRKPKKVIMPDEAATLSPHLDQIYRDAVDFVELTGLRPNELAGLHRDPERIDLKGGWLVVADVYVFKAKMIRGYPKDREPRVLPLSPKAIEILKRQMERPALENCGVPHMRDEVCRHDLVFRAPAGGVLNRDILGHHLRKAAAAAKIGAKPPYALRRGFATRLGRSNLDIFTLADLMGHSDINLTREYVGETDDKKSRVLASLGEPVPLKAVGSRGTDRGTEVDNQTSPEPPKDDAKHVV